MRYYSIILEDLAFKHSLRIYCIDRPGVGMSHTVEPEVSKKAKGLVLAIIRFPSSGLLPSDNNIPSSVFALIQMS